MMNGRTKQRVRLRTDPGTTGTGCCRAPPPSAASCRARTRRASTRVCGRQPLNGFTLCFRQSSICARPSACASSLYFSFSASSSGLISRIFTMLWMPGIASGNRSRRAGDREQDDRDAPVRDHAVHLEQERDQDLGDDAEEAEIDQLGEVVLAAARPPPARRAPSDRRSRARCTCRLARARGPPPGRRAARGTSRRRSGLRPSTCSARCPSAPRSGAGTPAGLPGAATGTMAWEK